MTAYNAYASPPFQASSSTSKDAALSVEQHAPAQCERIFAYLRDTRPQTREEVADGLGLRIQSVCARAAQLLAVGRIRELTETRPTKSGRQAKLLSAYVEPEAGTQFRLGDSLS